MSSTSRQDSDTHKNVGNSGVKPNKARPQHLGEPQPVVENGDSVSTTASMMDIDIVDLVSSDEEEVMEHLESSCEDDLPNCSFLNPTKSATKATDNPVRKTVTSKTFSSTKYSKTQTMSAISVTDLQGSHRSVSLVAAPPTQLGRSPATKWGSAGNRGLPSQLSHRSSQQAHVHDSAVAPAVSLNTKTSRPSNSISSSPSMAVSSKANRKVGPSKPSQSNTVSASTSRSSGKGQSSDLASGTAVREVASSRLGQPKASEVNVKPTGTPKPVKFRTPKSTGNDKATSRKKVPLPTKGASASPEPSRVLPTSSVSPIASSAERPTKQAVRKVGGKEALVQTSVHAINSTGKQVGSKSSSPAVGGKQEGVAGGVARPKPATPSSSTTATFGGRRTSGVSAKTSTESGSRSGSGGGTPAKKSEETSRPSMVTGLTGHSSSRESTSQESSPGPLAKRPKKQKESPAPSSNNPPTTSKEGQRSGGGSIPQRKKPPSKLSLSKKRAVEGPSGQPTPSRISELHPLLFNNEADDSVSEGVRRKTHSSAAQGVTKKDLPVGGPAHKATAATSETSKSNLSGLTAAKGKLSGDSPSLGKVSGNGHKKQGNAQTNKSSLPPLSPATSLSPAAAPTPRTVPILASLDTEMETSSTISMSSDMDWPCSSDTLTASSSDTLTASSQSSWDTESVASTNSSSSARTGVVYSKSVRMKRSVSKWPHVARKSTGGIWKRRYKAPFKWIGMKKSKPVYLHLKPIKLALSRVAVKASVRSITIGDVDMCGDQLEAIMKSPTCTTPTKTPKILSLQRKGELTSQKLPQSATELATSELPPTTLVSDLPRTALASGSPETSEHSTGKRSTKKRARDISPSAVSYACPPPAKKAKSVPESLSSSSSRCSSPTDALSSCARTVPHRPKKRRGVLLNFPLSSPLQGLSPASSEFCLHLESFQSSDSSSGQDAAGYKGQAAAVAPTAAESSSVETSERGRKTIKETDNSYTAKPPKVTTPLVHSGSEGVAVSKSSVSVSTKGVAAKPPKVTTPLVHSGSEGVAVSKSSITLSTKGVDAVAVKPPVVTTPVARSGSEGVAVSKSAISLSTKGVDMVAAKPPVVTTPVSRSGSEAVAVSKSAISLSTKGVGVVAAKPPAVTTPVARSGSEGVAASKSSVTVSTKGVAAKPPKVTTPLVHSGSEGVAVSKSSISLSTKRVDAVAAKPPTPVARSGSEGVAVSKSAMTSSTKGVDVVAAKPSVVTTPVARSGSEGVAVSKSSITGSLKRVDAIAANLASKKPVDTASALDLHGGPTTEGELPQARVSTITATTTTNITRSKPSVSNVKNRVTSSHVSPLLEESHKAVARPTAMESPHPTSTPSAKSKEPNRTSNCLPLILQRQKLHPSPADAPTLEHVSCASLSTTEKPTLRSLPLSRLQKETAAGLESSVQQALILSPQDKEYSLRLQETIAKLGGADAPAVQSTSQRAVPDPSSLVVTIPVSKLRKVLRLPPHKSSRQRIPKTKPALVTESGKTFTSQGVQADSGLVIDRNVLDSFLTVKVNEALLGLREQLRETESKVKQVTRDKARLEVTLKEKVKLIQELTQTGFKPNSPEEGSTPENVTQTKDLGGDESAAEEPQPAPSGSKTAEMECEWLSQPTKGSCSRCVAIKARPVSRREVIDTSSGPPVEWTLLSLELQGHFRNIYKNFIGITMLSTEKVVEERIRRLIDSLRTLLSNVAIPLTDVPSLPTSTNDIPGLPVFQLVSKLQDLEHVLKCVRVQDTQCSLPAYVKAEVVWTQQTTVDILHWLVGVYAPTIAPGNSNQPSASKQSTVAQSSSPAHKVSHQFSPGGTTSAIDLTTSARVVSASVSTSSHATTSSPSRFPSELTEVQLMGLLQSEVGALSSTNQLSVLKQVTQLFQKKVREVVVSMVKKKMDVPTTLLSLLAMTARLPPPDTLATTTSQSSSGAVPVAPPLSSSGSHLAATTQATPPTASIPFCRGDSRERSATKVSMSTGQKSSVDVIRVTRKLHPKPLSARSGSITGKESNSALTCSVVRRVANETIRTTASSSAVTKVSNGVTTKPSASSAFTKVSNVVTPKRSASSPTSEVTKEAHRMPVSSASPVSGTVRTKTAVSRQFTQLSDLIVPTGAGPTTPDVVFVTATSTPTCKAFHDVRSSLRVNSQQANQMVSFPVPQPPLYQTYPYGMVSYPPQVVNPYPGLAPGRVMVPCVPQSGSRIVPTSADVSSPVRLLPATAPLRVACNATTPKQVLIEQSIRLAQHIVGKISPVNTQTSSITSRSGIAWNQPKATTPAVTVSAPPTSARTSTSVGEGRGQAPPVGATSGLDKGATTPMGRGGRSLPDHSDHRAGASGHSSLPARRSSDVATPPSVPTSSYRSTQVVVATSSPISSTVKSLPVRRIVPISTVTSLPVPMTTLAPPISLAADASSTTSNLTPPTSRTGTSPLVTTSTLTPPTSSVNSLTSSSTPITSSLQPLTSSLSNVVSSPSLTTPISLSMTSSSRVDTPTSSVGGVTAASATPTPILSMTSSSRVDTPTSSMGGVTAVSATPISTSNASTISVPVTSCVTPPTSQGPPLPVWDAVASVTQSSCLNVPPPSGPGVSVITSTVATTVGASLRGGPTSKSDSPVSPVSPASPSISLEKLINLLAKSPSRTATLTSSQPSTPSASSSVSQVSTATRPTASSGLGLLAASAPATQSLGLRTAATGMVGLPPSQHSHASTAPSAGVQVPPNPTVQQSSNVPTPATAVTTSNTVPFYRLPVPTVIPIITHQGKVPQPSGTSQVQPSQVQQPGSRSTVEQTLASIGVKLQAAIAERTSALGLRTGQQSSTELSSPVVIPFQSRPVAMPSNTLGKVAVAGSSYVAPTIATPTAPPTTPPYARPPLSAVSILRPVPPASLSSPAPLLSHPGLHTLPKGSVSQSPSLRNLPRSGSALPPPIPLPSVSSLQHSLPTPRIQVMAHGKGIVIKWTFPEEHLHKQHYVDTYELFAWVSSSHSAEPPDISVWAKVGRIDPLSLPMQVTLTNFAVGQAYSFSVRAVFKGGAMSAHSQPKTLKL